MRWGQSFVAACVIWAIVVAWSRLSVGRESGAVFISWLVFCPLAGFFAGLAYRRLPGLAWLCLASILLAFGTVVLYWRAWPWEDCASGGGGDGYECSLKQFFIFWFGGLYALGVAAAIGVGVVVSKALPKMLWSATGCEEA